MIRSGSRSARATMSAPTRCGALELERLDGGDRPQQRDATADDDAFLDRRARGRERILDARLALLHLHLGGGADLDDRDATGEPGEPLLELLAVPVGGGLLHLLADLRAACLDGRLRAAAAHDGRVVLGDRDPPGGAELVVADRVEAQARLLADHRRPGEHGDVLEDRVAALAERGCLDRHRR